MKWVHQYFFFFLGRTQWMKIQLIGYFSVIMLCSSFHLWMRSPYFTLTTPLSIDLLLLNPVLNAIKFASRTRVAVSSQHGGAFSWPSLWRCNISWFESRKSSRNKRCPYTEEKRKGKKKGKNSVMAIIGYIPHYPSYMQTVRPSPWWLLYSPHFLVSRLSVISH